MFPGALRDVTLLPNDWERGDQREKEGEVGGKRGREMREGEREGTKREGGREEKGEEGKERGRRKEMEGIREKAR